jgi:uncharacterized protein
MRPRVSPVTRETFSECVDFIARNERRCITLMGNLVADGKPGFPGDGVKAFVRLDGNAGIGGVLFLTRTGILLHCLAGDLDREGYRPLLRNFLLPLNVRCIIGSGDDTRFIETLIAINPDRAVDYQLMTLETVPPEEKEAIAFRDADGSVPTIERGTPLDADELLPLQEGYEREEVIPPGDPFDRERSRLNLARNLETQCVWLVRAHGKAIAKAGTNARGLAWDQFGGVYTASDWRNRGIATALVACAARNRIQKGRKIALFVKLSNAQAIRAYTKVGFKADSPYRISYF